MTRLGVFGGTFDPPHLGHLILAETACDVLGLATVLFVLAADPPHKRELSLTAVEHRLAMLHLAIAENPRFAASDVDITRPGPHYTADTLQILQERHPDAVATRRRVVGHHVVELRDSSGARSKALNVNLAQGENQHIVLDISVRR